MSIKQDRYAKYNQLYTDAESRANEAMAWRRWASNRIIPHPESLSAQGSNSLHFKPRDVKHKSFTVQGRHVK